MYPPAFGTLLHDVCLIYAHAYSDKPSKEQQESYKTLFLHFFKNIPCPDCAAEAYTYFQEHPINVSNRKALLQYVVTMHNDINRKLKKKDNWTVYEALDSLARRRWGNLKNLSRADQMRIEDHKLMQDILQENKQLKEQLGLPQQKETMIEPEEKNDIYKMYYQESSSLSPDLILVAIVASLTIAFIFLLIFQLLR